MRNFLLVLTFLAGFTALGIGQVVYEDFDGGEARLEWQAFDGEYNGVVENPAPNEVNDAEFCGSYTKSGAHSFSLFLADLDEPMDLSTFNQFSIDINASAATSLLLKFEGAGVPPIERSAEIPIADEWVRLTFDMSGAADNAGLDRIILFFDPGVTESADTYLFGNLQATEAGECFEDFSSGEAQLEWMAFDGEYAGVVENPGPNQVNDSPTVGLYTKSDEHAFSLFLADLDEPFDLSVNNQFSIQIYATAATQVLMKIEGPGVAVEQTRNIALTNVWQEYTFDFSNSSDLEGFDRIILFFDPGVTESGDDYYFDKICARPAGACAGVVPDPLIIDDFECQRNATYGQGWDVLTVVDNPNVSADNDSPRVGRYEDPLDEWSALVIDYNDPIDLSTFNQIKAKIWSPKAGPLLFKLEGGISPPVEIFQDIEETGRWVDYTFDFSDQAAASHTRIAIFFNAGVLAEDGDVYFIDDIRYDEKVESTVVIEDFEDGLSLGWQPLDQNEAIHGIFSGPVSNPNPAEPNTSDNVGCYTKGSSPFSTLQAFSVDPIDISENSQVNLDVLSPEDAEGTSVRFILSSLSQGNRSAEANINNPGGWETLSFDFSAYTAIDDFFELRIIFDEGTANMGQQWCFDNITLGETTIDPCEGVVAIPNIIDDFECQRNYAYGVGAERLRVINNPDLTPENSSTRVGEYTDLANDPWAAITIEFPEGINLDVNNQFVFQIWSPVEAPILVKLEGGSSAPVEIFTDVTQTEFWQTIQVDFSEFAGGDYRRVAFFFNAGVSADETIVYLDNLRWSRESYFGCIADYETAASSITNFQYFANGTLEAEGYQFEVVDNPNPSGINESDRVGKFIKAGDAAPFAGMFADLDAAIDWKDEDKIFKAMVHMDHLGNFAVKLEGSATGQPPLEIPVENTLIDEWEELTFDFSAAADNAEYRRLTVFFDLGIDATGEDVVSYFDNLVVGEGECEISTSIFRPVEMEKLSIAPNPVMDELRVEHPEAIKRLDIINMYGVRVAHIQVFGEGSTWINVSNLTPGMYIIAGFNAANTQISTSKFIKQ